MGADSLAPSMSNGYLNNSDGSSSAFSSGKLSRQNSAEVLDRDNKENSGVHSNVFVRPKKNSKKHDTTSKIPSTKPRSRSGSRTRAKLQSTN